MEVSPLCDEQFGCRGRYVAEQVVVVGANKIKVILLFCLPFFCLCFLQITDRLLCSLWFSILSDLNSKIRLRGEFTN